MAYDNEIRQETISEFQKSQTVRLVDVLVIAPICVYAGVKYCNAMPKWLSISLIGIGVATAVYNAKNYMVNRDTEIEANKVKPVIPADNTATTK